MTLDPSFDDDSLTGEEIKGYLGDLREAVDVIEGAIQVGEETLAGENTAEEHDAKLEGTGERLNDLLFK